mmetsp:Transcript_17843/g.43670  ORF Transcript_17843/g.43670 Transcript_17843/m.43670 type:complete len:224 (+) Transcript_17843:2456-3127(+)
MHEEVEVGSVEGRHPFQLRPPGAEALGLLEAVEVREALVRGVAVVLRVGRGVVLGCKAAIAGGVLFVQPVLALDEAVDERGGSESEGGDDDDHEHDDAPAGPHEGGDGEDAVRLHVARVAGVLAPGLHVPPRLGGAPGAVVAEGGVAGRGSPRRTHEAAVAPVARGAVRPGLAGRARPRGGCAVGAGLARLALRRTKLGGIEPWHARCAVGRSEERRMGARGA